MGPLKGLRVLEFAGLGPAPFCAMLLADMGAEVVRIDRTQGIELGAALDPKFELNLRNRRSISLNLKSADGLAVARNLIARADALIEGFRPGVMERLGIGPADCHKSNPRLIYGRMTGWGQDGPLSQRAGHDINYIAMAGALNYLGSKGQPPAPPHALLGDLGGGGMYLAFGIVCALLEAKDSGIGQVVDAAIIDGVSSLLTSMHGRRTAGSLRDGRGENTADGSRPWYRAYETKDGKWVTISPIEGRFYQDLLGRLGLDKEALPPLHDPAGWPALERRFADTFRQKTQREWIDLLEATDACFAPVLTLPEVIQHPHAKARAMFTEFGGMIHPLPAPRFSRTVPEIHSAPAAPGTHTDDVLADSGYSADEIADLRRSGAVA